MVPWSSSGRKPAGRWWNSAPAASQKQNSTATAKTDFRISALTPTRYLFRERSKTRSNARKNRPSGPRVFILGRRRRALRAGLSESALNAEIRTEAAMVSANCL